MKKLLLLLPVILLGLPAYAQTSDFYVNSATGDVGVGTISPVNLLDVNGRAVIGANYAGVITAPANGLLVQGVTSIGTSSVGSEMNVYGGVSIGTGYVGTAAPANGTIIQGKVGIGTSSPTTFLTINGNSSTPLLYNNPGSLVQIVGANSTSTTIEGAAYGGSFGLEAIRYDGTASSPTTLQTNDIMSGWGAAGYNGTAVSTIQQVGIQMNAGGVWSASSEPTYIDFQTTPVGSITRAERMRIAPSGDVGIGTTGPLNLLDVSGDVAIGTAYAGIHTAPANGMLVQGVVGIGTTAPYSTALVHIYNGSTTGTTSDNAEEQITSINRNAAISLDSSSSSAGAVGFYSANAIQAAITYWNASNYLAFYTNEGGVFNANERMRINASGDIGIGTTGPLNLLDVSGNLAIGTSYAGVKTAPTNGMLVQGAVGIGTSSPYSGTQLHVYNGNTTGTGSDNAEIQLTSINRNANLILDGSAATTGAVSFFAADTVEGAIAYFNSTNYMAFYTNEAGIFGGNERMRIDSSGNLAIGTTAARGGAKLDVNGTIYVASFASGSSTTVCQNGNVLSACTSARRFKENIEPSQLGLKEVLQMRPVTFDLRDHKDNWERHDFGFVAEEMEQINPLFVTYDDNGQINGVRYMQLTAVNTKAIQELHDRIEKQQEEIDSLQQAIKQLTMQK